LRRLSSTSQSRTAPLYALLRATPEGCCGALGARQCRERGGATGRGVRVVYYYHNPTISLFLLTVFAKNERDNLSPRDRNILQPVVSEIVNTYGKHHPHERSR